MAYFSFNLKFSVVYYNKRVQLLLVLMVLSKLNKHNTKSINHFNTILWYGLGFLSKHQVSFEYHDSPSQHNRVLGGFSVYNNVRT